MTHWRKFMDPREYIYAEDLAGRDVDVQIAKITQGELAGEKGRKSKKPLVFFTGKQRPLALNKTNCKTIERIAGSPDTDAWVGQWVTLFPSTTQDPNGNPVECVRIRPRAPNRKGKTPDAPEPVLAPATDEHDAEPPSDATGSEAAQ